MNWQKYTLDEWLEQFGANSAIETIKAYLELRDMTQNEWNNLKINIQEYFI